MKKSHFLASLAVFLIVSIHAVPSRADDCIVYQDGNRGGAAWGAVSYEAADLGGIWWNDRISSVWVRPGYRLRLFQNSDFSGGITSFYGTSGGTPTPDGGRYFNLGSGWNDAASGFVCESLYDASGPACTVYQNSDGSGASWSVSAGRYVAVMGDWSDRTSDVSVADNHSLIAFEDMNFTGSSRTFEGCHWSAPDLYLCPWYDLHGEGWGDRISSFLCVSN